MGYVKVEVTKKGEGAEIEIQVVELPRAIATQVLITALYKLNNADDVVHTMSENDFPTKQKFDEFMRTRTNITNPESKKGD